MSLSVVNDTAPLIEARGLRRCCHRGSPKALLDGINLIVSAGDRVVLAGPSGSGKTLLLRALALLDPLEAGEVLWQGQPIRCDRVPQYRRQAIYVHQRPALSGDSVEEAIRWPLRLRSNRRCRFDRARIEGLLARLGRDGAFLEKPPRDLSGGELQIAALVRVLQIDPNVLLLDEPTAAMDTHTTRRAEALLDDWLAERPDARAIVWVSHDPLQSERIAARTLHMVDGRLTEDSPHAG